MLTIFFPNLVYKLCCKSLQYRLHSNINEMHSAQDPDSLDPQDFGFLDPDPEKIFGSTDPDPDPDPDPRGKN